MTRPLTILFSGMIAGDPWQGGATWAVLQYVLGLVRLGHRVYFVEPIKPSAVRPAGSTLAESDNARYFRDVTRQFEIEGTSTLLPEGGGAAVGVPRAQLIDIARRADLLINVSGMLTDPEILAAVPVRAYLDLDPAFVQMWHAFDGIDMRFGAHTHFVTVGRAVGTAGCTVPTCGREWITTLQPVVLAHWPAVDPDRRPARDAWTTIANWRGYGSIERNGVLFGQKAHSLRRLIDLPRRTSQRILLALSIHPGESKDLEALAANQWDLTDPADVAGTPDQYRAFIQGSKGEFGVAKSGYVASRCGWFSDRSACYLASGRPVVAQDTGFSQFLPVGKGLLAFDDAAGAAAALDTVAGDYAGHCRAARAMAEQYFDSDSVLSRLLTELEVAR